MTGTERSNKFTTVSYKHTDVVDLINLLLNPIFSILNPKPYTLIPQADIETRLRRVGAAALAGYLAHKKPHPRRSLQLAYAQGPMGALGGGGAFLTSEAPL